MEELALEIAHAAHEGQIDPDGRPHIDHVLRVADGLEGEARLAAILHDVIEDAPWTRDALVAAGFSDRVAGAVDIVSRRDGEPYEAFIERIVDSDDDLAIVVKRADVRDNLTRSEAAGNERRVRRYREALALLDASRAE
jgi:(p)ppGpp synthase/HD superfamily hydrolase